MTRLLLHEVSLGERLADVVCDGETIASVDPPRRRGALDAEVVIEGEGRPLIPGLHDHHIHLLATAAAARSVKVGPPEVTTRGEMIEALRQCARSQPSRSWIRAVGYHESVAGDLDRPVLDGVLADAAVRDHPVRVQHRSGALWILDSRACDALHLDDPHRTTGRIWRADDWLRERLASHGVTDSPPDLTSVGAELAAMGVTGVTDATPHADTGAISVLVGAVSTIPQRVHAMSGVGTAAAVFPSGVTRGPVKIIVADHDLPTIDDLAAAIAIGHDSDRPVALHCVTRAALVLALAAWAMAGVHDGDRIEHASLIPPALITRIARMGLRVVTQPNFIAERGDQYLGDLDATDLDDLYRLRSLIDADIRVAAGTDAPYGDPDPWKAVTAAMRRTTGTGHTIGAGERVSAASALALFWSRADDPGGPVRRIAPGEPADLVLLGRSMLEVFHDGDRRDVVATVIGGRVAHASPRVL